MTELKVGDTVNVTLEAEVAFVYSSGEFEFVTNEGIELAYFLNELPQGVTIEKYVRPLKAGDLIQASDGNRFLILANIDSDGEYKCFSFQSEMTFWKTFDLEYELLSTNFGISEEAA